MAEADKEIPANALTAEQLLQNKGIKYYALNEYEKSFETLPKTGKKEFEPNGSWLQNMQLEKGITTRKNLIGIERVDRISQLASAEWLSAQKKARVTKCSGQDWCNFGLERNNHLYLIPEEALFLLEANCLELTWNDMPLSIQQAYELLIDNTECSIEEYRVYSHLVRYGYRIQRFIYNSERHGKNNENSVKRKVIIDPESGLWKTDDQQQIETSKKSDKELNQNNENTKTNADVNNDSDIEIYLEPTKETIVLDDVCGVMDDLLSAVEMIKPRVNDNNVQTEEVNKEKRKKNSKARIISEETLLGNIKIITDPTNNSSQENNAAMNWRGSRIQRNVKLLPKRIDKPSSNNDITTLDINPKNSEHHATKHKSSLPLAEELHIKKSKQEVIELSDDEIEEVPRSMTRMDILNLIPNIASQLTITINISRAYIPHNIKPQKTIYSYESKQLKRLQEKDEKLRTEVNRENSNRNTSHRHHRSRTPTSRNPRVNANVLPYNQNCTQNVLTQNYVSVEYQRYASYEPVSSHNNRSPYAYGQNSYWYHRYQPVPRNHFHSNFHHSPPLLRRFHHLRVVENMSIHCSITRNESYSEPRQRYWSQNNHHLRTRLNNDDQVYRSSFKLLSEVSSWSELKAKWREKRTITIDDEDTQIEETDCNEVQIVELRNPLVEPKNAHSLEEIFSRLKIIKSAPEKSVRKRKSKYKISYNVYSNTQAYRKACPGSPLYRVVIIRQEDPFIEPIELHRLQQDANNSPIVLACVSMSISFIQPGFVSIPTLT